jgi:nitroreductase
MALGTIRNSMEDTTYAQLAEVIRRRKTMKVIGNPSKPLEFTAAEQLVGDAIVQQAIGDAGWAPFHYDRQVDGIAEPWRATILPQSVCREIGARLADWCPDLKPGNKMPAMLSACGCVVLVTWLPQTSDDISDEVKLSDVNFEHVAAASAFVQNLLLLLEAKGFGTYWGSGGMFCDRSIMNRLGMSSIEKLLAAVYVQYPTTKAIALERIPGGNRARRQPASEWSRTVRHMK